MKYLIFISQFLFVLAIMGQNTDILIEVSDTEVSVGQNISISITTSLNGNIEFDFPSNFQKGYAQMEGMSQEYINGKSKTIYYKNQNGYFTEKGKYVIGPAIIKHKGKLYKSNKVKVSVKKSNKSIPKKNDFNKNLKTIKTFYGEINVSKDEIYEGESVHLNAKVYSKYAFSKYGYTPYTLDGKYDEYEIKNTIPLALVEEQIGGESYYTLELDNRVFFPVKSGTYMVVPFGVDIIDRRVFRVNADEKKIKVKPLPNKDRPGSFTGLVGNFDFEVELSNNEAGLNEVITLQLTITGEGNLHHAIAPELNLPDEVELYADPVEVKDYQIGKNGFKGELNYTYPLKVVKMSPAKLPEIDFSYFDPKKKRYITEASPSFLINDHTDTTDLELVQGGAEENPATAKSNNTNTNTSTKSKKSSEANSRWILYILICLILIGGFLALWLFIRSRAQKNERSNALPTSKEIKLLLKEIDHFKVTSDSNVLLSKMEECLSITCSFTLETDLFNISRNEMFVLLLDKMDKEDLDLLKKVYNELDLLRFSKESKDSTIKDIKTEFNGLIKSILSSKA